MVQFNYKSFIKIKVGTKFSLRKKSNLIKNRGMAKLVFLSFPSPDVANFLKNPLVPLIALISVCASQMALSRFFCDSSLLLPLDEL